MWLSAINTNPDTPQSSGMPPVVGVDLRRRHLRHTDGLGVRVEEMSDQLLVRKLAGVAAVSVYDQVQQTGLPVLITNSVRRDRKPRLTPISGTNNRWLLCVEPALDLVGDLQEGSSRRTARVGQQQRAAAIS